MTKKLVIHLGHPKTGTSSLRQFFEINISYLESQNIYLPFIHEKIWNIGLASIFSNQIDNSFYWKINNISFVDEKINHLNNKYEQLCLFARKLPYNSTMILSSEFLASIDVNGISKIKNFAGLFFDDITIIAYLREQASFALAASSTGALNGKRTRIQEPGENKNMNFNIWLSDWLQFFRPNQFKIRLYERPALVDQDIISDFLHTLGFNYLSSYVKKLPPSRVTESATTIKYLFCLNHLYQSHDSSLISLPSRTKSIKLVRDMFNDNTVLCFSSESAQKYRDYYHSVNNWVVLNFFDNKKKELFLDYKLPDLSNKQFIDEKSLLFDQQDINLLIKMLKS
ncbi:hypothetical protein [Synechococcus sp. ROS8604]|uniref:hypothetical protein n=1 Tax=Synechococcus sp. ROS8604 TaxID=1442557 RepID=UPI0016474058|nr:hypothetical protein [Synechococcus sp. ROS8604]QNI86907.1 hypothetical protein SynROS8604_00236 [Synechococcus sp. ROS8604]